MNTKASTSENKPSNYTFHLFDTTSVYWLNCGCPHYRGNRGITAIPIPMSTFSRLYGLNNSRPIQVRLIERVIVTYDRATVHGRLNAVVAVLRSRQDNTTYDCQVLSVEDVRRDLNWRRWPSRALAATQPISATPCLVRQTDVDALIGCPALYCNIQLKIDV